MLRPWMALDDGTVIFEHQVAFSHAVLRHYCGPTTMGCKGPAYLRPWQLPFQAKMGLKGLVEAET